MKWKRKKKKTMTGKNKSHLLHHSSHSSGRLQCSRAVHETVRKARKQTAVVCRHHSSHHFFARKRRQHRHSDGSSGRQRSVGPQKLRWISETKLLLQGSDTCCLFDGNLQGVHTQRVQRQSHPDLTRRSFDRKYCFLLHNSFHFFGKDPSTLVLNDFMILFLIYL